MSHTSWMLLPILWWRLAFWWRLLTVPKSSSPKRGICGFRSVGAKTKSLKWTYLLKSFLCWQISHLVKSSYVHQWRGIPDFSQYNHIKHRPTHDFVSDQILNGLRQIEVDFDMVPSWLSWPGGLKQCHKTTKTLGAVLGLNVAWIVGIWKGLNKIQHVFMENIQKLKYISMSFWQPILHLLRGQLPHEWQCFSPVAGFCRSTKVICTTELGKTLTHKCSMRCLCCRFSARVGISRDFRLPIHHQRTHSDWFFLISNHMV